MLSPWLQPVVQRAESGPWLHGTRNQGDERRAGQPPERRGEYDETQSILGNKPATFLFLFHVSNFVMHLNAFIFF